MKDIKNLYRSHMKNGWTLNQLDEMDIHFYLSLGNEENEEVFIDEIKLF
ncbi:hypothetical protein [Alkalihalophilus marmarensis]|nr:hypothetical protein [Alkalihalophilus marmarensis]